MRPRDHELNQAKYRLTIWYRNDGCYVWNRHTVKPMVPQSPFRHSQLPIFRLHQLKAVPTLAPSGAWELDVTKENFGVVIPCVRSPSISKYCYVFYTHVF